ncbi:centromere-associated protein E-like [Belonocnema kinseyi]|uniref:centromere-associated protein E-like n=1 Tax=Belonocnema kinseyi TaxID=2817044 RepID=UPI00143D551C|nr:centromere-associated protein E-like [Belonocnema kinseyi]
MANIKVAVRVRPISERELNFTGSKLVVKAQSNEIALTNLKVSSWKTGDSRERTKTYGFDYCFDSSNPDSENYATQAKIYETLGESVLNSLFSGYNACLVAYGQSASGKTYTMMGTKDDPGLTPRLCEGLFTRIAQEKNNGKPYQASVSYLEIYNERVRDLLKPTSSASGLRVREHPRLGPYVQDFMFENKCQKTARTLSFLPRTLQVPPKDSEPRVEERHEWSTIKKGPPCFLALEGANINKSLVALGNVISALAERGSSGNFPGRRFIPYRDSALTWLLKDALGGNAATIMLATISPASGSYNETAHTLRFAQRAQSVVNRPVVNEDPIARIIRELRAEVTRLRNLLHEKDLEGGIKPLCSCRQNSDQETEGQDQKVLQVVPFCQKSSSPEFREPQEFITLPLRKYNSNESLVTRDQKPSNIIRRFGSFESISPRESFASEARSNRYRVSELSYYEGNEPAFVDIPTLVAVLIKPDDTSQEHSTQIEEICSDGLLEESIDPEFPEDSNGNLIQKDTPPLKEDTSTQVKDNNTQSVEVVLVSKGNIKIDRNSCRDPKRVRENCAGTDEKPKERVKLRKQDSVDTPSKKSSNLQTSRTFGSVEGISKKREVPGLGQRSHTNLEKRSGPEKLKKLNNIKEVEDRRTSSRIGSVWRGLGASGGKYVQRKGSNDSEKSLRDSASQHKTRNPSRKLSIDDLKRKTSKDSSSSSSKDEQILITGLAKDNYQRKGSLQERGSDQESSGRSHTPIQRVCRAEIVAAVTERLYSSGKKSEEGTGATTPASDYRSPESTDVTLAALTRMRLQEISRRMLAKRRKVSVDTQTTNSQTIRVRDTASLTEEPKIEVRDAAVLTEQHEACERLSESMIPVRRVKEIATLTERRKPSTVRYKNAGNITDDCDEDFDIHSLRNDSGILSDDTQNYTDSNISSAEMLDFGEQERRSVESSTNTDRFSKGVDCGAQTRKDDLLKHKCSHCELKCCSRMQDCCYRTQDFCSQSHNSSYNNSHNHRQCQSSSEKSVISINLPDMIRIRIESPNILESRISVVDEDLRTRFRDREVQTDKWTTLEKSTSTDDINHRIYFNDFIGNTKTNASQTDGRTFRIENIFQEPKDTRCPIEIMADLGEEPSSRTSLVFTKSVGTSMHTPLDFQSPLKALRRRLSLIRRSKSFNPNRRVPSAHQIMYPSSELIQSLNPVQEHMIERTRMGQLIPTSYRKSLSSPENRFLTLRTHFDQYLTTSRGDANFFDGTRSQTSRMDDEKECQNMEAKKTLDPYFSDDSLDLMEDRISDASESIKEVKVDETPTQKENICPPDVVAHTKKESLKGQKSNGESFVEFSSQENLEPIDSENESNTKKKKVSFSAPSIVEVEGQSSGDSNQTGVVPKSIIKKMRDINPHNLEEEKEESNSEENLEDLRQSLENLRMDDSSHSEHFESEDQDSTSGERNVLENYLDEAVTFIRNVNSMNDYASAANFLEKYLHSTRPSRKLPNRNREYVEYEGHRVSLKDDTDQYLNDEEFEVPNKAYQKCLQGIEKLEQCIGKVKDHETCLKQKYGIGVEPAGAKSSLAISNQDPMGGIDHRYDNDVDSDNNIVGSDLEWNIGSNSNANLGTSFGNYLESADNNFDSSLDTRIYDRLNQKSRRYLKVPKSSSSYSKDFFEDPDIAEAQKQTGFSHTDRIKAPNCFLSVPSRDNLFSKRWKNPASFRQSSLPRLTSSSNDSFSSSETIAASSESVDSISNLRDKLRYPGSPRARFLQLLNERRRIVESSRKFSKF